MARVRFRVPASAEGFIDAGWWPRSTDLSTELPPLLRRVWSEGLDVRTASFCFRAWRPAPHRITVEGRVVRLGGFLHHERSMLSLTDSASDLRIDLLIVPPDAPDELADRLLAGAARPHSLDRPAAVFARAGYEQAR